MNRKHFPRHLLALTASVLLTLSQPLSADQWTVVEAGQTNVFLDQPGVQTHLVHRPNTRTVFAFPAENSGVALWYQGEIEYVPGSLKVVSGEKGQTVEAQFQVKKETRLQQIMLDSIRMIRDLNDGAETPQKAERTRSDFALKHPTSPNWATPRMTWTAGAVSWSRSQPTVGEYSLSLQSPALEKSSETVVLSPGPLTVIAHTPFPAQKKLSQASLFRPDYDPRASSLSSREKDALRALGFLTTQDKLMAGSWRFLTYFGRDTLISLSMLEPILSDEAMLGGIQSVLSRLSAQGAVAHEEDIGSWAEWRHLEEQPSELSLQPVYDYKMVDDDLLLPVLLGKLLELGRTEVVHHLMDDPESRATILKNADYVMKKLARRQPILLNPGESVGDWRDSENGLAGGNNAYSVNGALTVAALQSLVRLYAEFQLQDKMEAAQTLLPYYQLETERFWFTLTPREVEKRLANFTASLPAGERARFEKLASTALPKSSLSIPRLSFNPDGSGNQVSHTDLAFNLFYQDLTESQLSRIVSFLEQPFPIGVITPVGPVVANPVLSENPSLYKSLGFGQYHGMVVWSWQSAMLSLGLVRQAEHHPAYRSRITLLLKQLEEAELRVGELANSELWGVTVEQDGVTARGYGQAGDQTESNALQLWSTVYPAVRFVKANFHGKD